MAKDYQGWNPLSRNPNGAMTDVFDLETVSLHHTINVDSEGDITKSHTTFDAEDESMKIYPDGNTSLHNTKKDDGFNSNDNNSGNGFGGASNSFNGF